MKLLKSGTFFLIGLGLLLSISACTEEPDCMIADQVELVTTVTKLTPAHYLYKRVSGFSDKVTILEMYTQQPQFDQCGKSNQVEIASVVVDDTAGNPERIVIDGKLLDIEYSSAVFSDPELSSLPIVVR